MKHCYKKIILSMIFILGFCPLFGQESNMSVISIQSFSAKDYYALKKVKEENLGFKIIESCIPKGLLAIEFLPSLPEKERNEHMQRMILEYIDRLATPTAYQIADLRNACQSYRDEINE